MNVVCAIFVMINMSGIRIQTDATWEGKVKYIGPTNYLVDFSAEAKRNKLVEGDYSKVLVKKDKCVEEK